MDFHSILGKVKRNVGHMKKIIGEILLDHIALVAEANDEIVEAVLTVDFHDVPEDGPPADLDHRLGANAGFFGQTSAHSTGQNDSFHQPTFDCTAFGTSYRQFRTVAIDDGQVKDNIRRNAQL